MYICTYTFTGQRIIRGWLAIGARLLKAAQRVLHMAIRVWVLRASARGTAGTLQHTATYCNTLQRAAP